MRISRHKRMALAALQQLDDHLTTRSYDEVGSILEGLFKEICEDHLRQYQRGYQACERKWKRRVDAAELEGPDEAHRKQIIANRWAIPPN